jgi:hypothetical protein
MAPEDKKQENEQFVRRLIDLLEKGEIQPHELKAWESLEKKEKEILEKVRTITKENQRKNRIYLFAGAAIFFVISVISGYLYLSYIPKSESYSILPGNVKELDMKFGKMWINSSSTINVNDSIITLREGEIYIKKDRAKDAIIVNTPIDRVQVVSGNANIVYRKLYQRITSLGETNVYHKGMDTVKLAYGKELRSDSTSYTIQTIRSTEYVGAFKMGKIAFENESLPFVLEQLGAFYGIKINYTIIPNVLVSFIAERTHNPEPVIRQLLPQPWTLEKKGENEYFISPDQVTKSLKK